MNINLRKILRSRRKISPSVFQSKFSSSTKLYFSFFPGKFLLEILYRYYYYRKRVRGRDIFPSRTPRFGSSDPSIRPTIGCEKKKKGSGRRKMVGFEGKIVDSSRINVITDVDDDGDEATRKTSMQSVTSHLFTTSIRWTCGNNLAR